MVTTDNKAWLAQHDANYRTLKAMERRQEWRTFVARLELGWYDSWAAVMANAGPAYFDPLKPWTWFISEGPEIKPKPPEPPGPPGPIEPPMTVFARQMFEQTGTLTAQAPGGFDRVTGTLYQMPEGARLEGGLAASAEHHVYSLGGNNTTMGYFATGDNPSRMVAGAWFYFRAISGGAGPTQIMAFGQTDPYIGISLSNGGLVANVAYGPIFATLPFIPVANAWLYLSLAMKNIGGSNWNIRVFYKKLGAANKLTQWGSGDNLSTSPTIDTAMWGIFWNNPSWDGLMSACTLHLFEKDDFSDVVYPSEVLEPV